MKKEMLINVLQPEECRIAILENGTLEELYVERTSHESYVGNIYKGRIVNIEPSIQAAFVDFGVGRNGFLHVSDVEPAYYRHLEQQREENPRRRGRKDRQEGVSRPGVVIPSGRKPAPEQPPEEDYCTVEELVEEVELPPDVLHEGLPPGLGLPVDIAVVSEDLADQDDWFEEDAETEQPESAEEEEPGFSSDVEEETSFARWHHEKEIAGESESVPFARGEFDPPEDYSSESDASFETSTEETSSEEEPGETEEERDQAEKPRRRGRGGRGRKNKNVGRKGKPEGEESSDAAEETPRNPSAFDEERPRPMDSAERRTSKNEEGELTYSGSGGGALEPDSDDLSQSEADVELFRQAEEESAGSDPADDLSDEDLSFSLRPSESYLSSALEAPLVEDIEPAEETAPEDFTEEEGPRGDVLETPVEAEDMHKRMARELSEDLTIIPPRRGGRDRDRDRDRGGERDRGRGPRGRNGRRGPSGGRAGMGRPKPLIQDIFKKGQEVLVQVIKEGIGTKGPTLSTYISIAGRYLVLMPGLNRIGVSRKIQDEEQRRRLRDILSELKPPKGLGFIIRTAGMDRNKKELQRDLAYLARLWQVVVRRIRKLKSPAEIYQESDMITRTIRDTFTSEIQSIIIDEPKAFEHAQEFMQIVLPRYASRIKCYSDAEPVFHKYGIEKEISRIHQKTVPLPNGGSIVIEQTEALVAIDVNSGNFRADNNAEETAYQINLQAAREIARQLRLRDLGGVVVNDFIDMREEKHRRGVERALRDAVRRDRARTKVLKMSQFGIIEMTRQRIRPSLKRSVYENCPACSGAGQVKTCESMSIEVMRMLQLAAHRGVIYQIQVRVHPSVALYLLNPKRREVYDLEQKTNTQISIEGVQTPSPEFLQFSCYDNNNNEIQFPPQEIQPRPRRRSYS